MNASLKEPQVDFRRSTDLFVTKTPDGPRRPCVVVHITVLDTQLDFILFVFERTF